jgi:hypothetical protein
VPKYPTKDANYRILARQREPGFLLFMRAQTLGQRTGHGIPL